MLQSLSRNHAWYAKRMLCVQVRTTPTKHVLHCYILCMPNSVFQRSSNVFICKTRTLETSMDELITSQTVLRCRDLNVLRFLNYYCMFWTYVINEGHSLQILTVATPQKLFKTISNSGHSWRHGQTWLISHQEFDTRFAGTSTTSLFEMS